MKRSFADRFFAAALAVAFCVAMTACTVDQVLTDIDLALQMSANIAAAIEPISPADAALLTLAINIATTGLQVIQTDYDQWKASGAQTDLQKLEAALTTLKTNLPMELAAAHITNPASIAKANAWVNLVVTTCTAVLQLLPQTPGTAAMAVFPTPQKIKAGWDMDICAGAKTCSDLVKIHKIR
jgi:hypothetical protein